MNQVNCPICGKKCVKSGKTKAGSQRWFCKSCKTSSTHKINNESKELQFFLDWLFGKESQAMMPGEGRTFRRKTVKFWNIWAMPPKVEGIREYMQLVLNKTYCIFCTTSLPISEFNLLFFGFLYTVHSGIPHPEFFG